MLIKLKTHAEITKHVGFAQVSIKVLEGILTGQSNIQWQALNYMMGEVTYGGRVADNWDKQCLKTLLYRFCNPEVLKDGFSFSSDEVRKERSFSITFN